MRRPLIRLRLLPLIFQLAVGALVADGKDKYATDAGRQLQAKPLLSNSTTEDGNGQSIFQAPVRFANGSRETVGTTVIPPPAFSSQRRMCNAVTPFIGVWYASYLLCSTAILIAVVYGLRDVGAIWTMPHLAGTRYSLFAGLWAQGLMQLIWAFREPPRDGCFVPHQFLLIARIPMELGKIEAPPLPDIITNLAITWEHMMCGYTTIMLLVAMPRLRLQFCPDNQVVKKRLSRKCAMPALIILLLVNPLLTVMTIQHSLTWSIVVETCMFTAGTVLAWLAGLEERIVASELFDHIYHQEWVVLMAALTTRLGKLLVAGFFHDQTANFLVAFIGTVSTLAVLAHLALTAAPWQDPLMWLIYSGIHGKVKSGERLGRTFVRFLFVSDFYFMFALVLKYELEPLGITVGLNEDSNDPEERSELMHGREACREWARWAEKVGSQWPGLKDDRWGDEMKNVAPPSELTPQELALKEIGQLQWRSKWGTVLGDLFSDRVHSQVIAVIWTVIILTEPVTWSMLTKGRTSSLGWSDTALIFLKSLLFCLGMWSLLALLLLGNNVFLPLCACKGVSGRAIWLWIVCFTSVYSGATQLGDMLETVGALNPSHRPYLLVSPMDLDKTGLLYAPSLQICWSFLHFALAAQLFSTSLQQACIARLPAVKNTYHKLEFAAQRYCQKLLEGELKSSANIDQMMSDGVKGVSENQIFLINRGGGHRPCRVIAVAKDGTCTAVFQGGEVVKGILYKELEPLRTEARLSRQDKKDFMAMMEALGPTMDAMRGGVRSRAGAPARDHRENRISDTAKAIYKMRSSVGVDENKSERPSRSDNTSMSDRLRRTKSCLSLEDARSKASSFDDDKIMARTFSQYKKTVMRRASLHEEMFMSTEPSGLSGSRGLGSRTFFQQSRGLSPSRSENSNVSASLDDSQPLHASIFDEALVTVACEEGKSRAKHLESQRKQSTGFRAFFNSSVGLSGLMLTSLLIGPMLVILCSTFLASRTSEFEFAMNRMWHGGAYALRVQVKDFHYGACGRPTPEDFADCVSQIGHETACSSPEEILMLTFDWDQSDYLDDKELDSMSSILAGINSASNDDGQIKHPVLTVPEFRALTKAAAIPGADHLDVQGVSRFLCSVSRVLKEQEVIQAQALSTGISLDNMTADYFFNLADRNPKNGFITESELMAVLPTNVLLTTQHGKHALSLYTTALRVGFMLGDIQPADGQVSHAEFEVSYGPIVHLLKALPMLSEKLEELQNMARRLTAGDDSKSLAVMAAASLDLDGDGALNRPEVGLLAAVMKSSSVSSPLSGEVLPLFDRSDANGDGLLMANETEVLFQQLTSMFPLIKALSSQDARKMDADSLAIVLDSDGDGISPSEFDRISMLFPVEMKPQASFISSLIFVQSDTSPRDGRLSNEELKVSLKRVRALRYKRKSRRRLQESQGGDTTTTTTPSPSKKDSRLSELMKMLSFAVDMFVEGKLPSFGKYLFLFLNLFKSELFSIILPSIICAMRVSILGAVACANFMMLKTKSEHEKLTQRIQMGDHSYCGGTHRKRLRNSFAASTSFPGLFIATVVINYFVAAFLLFVCMVLLITPPLLLAVPRTRHLVYEGLLVLRYPILAGFAKLVLKRLVVDRLLVSQGQPVYPGLFAPLWLSLLLINFVQAPFLAGSRWALLVIRGTISSTFIHVCAFSESCMFFDPGYQAFISMTFTQSTRRNLVRTCFISAIMPQAQRVRSQCPPQGPDMETREAKERKRRLRVRNKLWVAVTLRNNPSLRQERRVSREQEFGSLTTLWNAENEGNGLGSPSASPCVSPTVLGESSNPMSLKSPQAGVQHEVSLNEPSVLVTPEATRLLGSSPAPWASSPHSNPDKHTLLSEAPYNFPAFTPTSCSSGSQVIIPPAAPSPPPALVTPLDFSALHGCKVKEFQHKEKDLHDAETSSSNHGGSDGNVARCIERDMLAGCNESSELLSSQADTERRSSPSGAHSQRSALDAGPKLSSATFVREERLSTSPSPEQPDSSGTPSTRSKLGVLMRGSTESSDVQQKLDSPFLEEAKSTSRSVRSRASPQSHRTHESGSSPTSPHFSARQLLFGAIPTSYSATEVSTESLHADHVLSTSRSVGSAAAAGAAAAEQDAEHCVPDVFFSDTWSCGSEPLVETPSLVPVGESPLSPTAGSASSRAEKMRGGTPGQPSFGSPSLASPDEEGGESVTPVTVKRRVSWNPVPEVREMPRLPRVTRETYARSPEPAAGGLVSRLNLLGKEMGLGDWMSGLTGSDQTPQDRPDWSVTPKRSRTASPNSPMSGPDGDAGCEAASSRSPGGRGYQGRTFLKTNWSLAKGSGHAAESSIRDDPLV